MRRGETLAVSELLKAARHWDLTYHRLRTSHGVVMPDRALAQDFDINAIGRDFLEDPYSILAALREHDSVHRNPDGSYFLTRHADLLGSTRTRR